VQVLRGEVEIAGHPLVAGDGASLSQVDELSVRAASPAEVMVFDLA
jgi:hypothetical protein